MTLTETPIRVFEDKPSERKEVPCLIGLVGPSGCGKTYSALRLATGIQSVVGGDIFGIDTEAGRMLHYADVFKFRHVEFKAPFDPMSYLAALQHCIKRGAKTVIIDSASHLHEGTGGVLEMHEAECKRLMELWKKPYESVQLTAWNQPKTELRNFIKEMLQLKINIIWCFRAKEKLKVIPGKAPQAMGLMPIASDELIYEMTVNCLLYPNSGGNPKWHPDESGEKGMIKLPRQFFDIFSEEKPLDEKIGIELAKWSSGLNGNETVIKRELTEPSSKSRRQSVIDIFVHYKAKDLIPKNMVNGTNSALDYLQGKEDAESDSDNWARVISYLEKIELEIPANWRVMHPDFKEEK